MRKHFADWNKFVDRKIKHWQDLYLHCLTHSTNITVVHYENIKENPEKSIWQILSFLNVDLDPNPTGHFLCKSSTKKLKSGDSKV